MSRVFLSLLWVEEPGTELHRPHKASQLVQTLSRHVAKWIVATHPDPEAVCRLAQGALFSCSIKSRLQQRLTELTTLMFLDSALVAACMAWKYTNTTCAMYQSISVQLISWRTGCIKQKQCKGPLFHCQLKVDTEM